VNRAAETAALEPHVVEQAAANVTAPAGWAPSRIGGWAPIEQYGVLSNGGTVALVAADGQVDWWPLPTLDAPPVFAALLDPEFGGCLQLRPEADFTVTRRYVGDANVLETTFFTSDGVVRVTDALTVGKAGRLPWGELVRRVEGEQGRVPMRWSVQPGTRFDSAQPWTNEQHSAILVHCGDQHLALRCFDIGAPEVERQAVTGRFVTEPASRGTFALTASDDCPVFLPTRAALEDRLDRTIRQWHEWSASMTYDGPWREQVLRSALALKLLLFEQTGAIAAAATTSLPERIGGDKNWDYRYMWIRDASFTVDAFLNLGLHEEVQGAVTWLLRSVRSTTPGLKVFYELGGGVPSEHKELSAPGYRNSRPVRAGNGAADQTQLGTFGDLFDSIWKYVAAGHLLDPVTGRLLADLADRCCDIWMHQDAGIWELHTNRHYTISKIGCWVALDRAVRLHKAGQVPCDHAFRWADERDTIKAWVNANCWSAEKGSYTFYAGSEELDAATLLAGPTGFDRGDRLAGTIDAVRRELARGPLIYRYTGMDAEEGAFLACSFWLVTALASLGRRQEAALLMDESVALVNDLGLLSEQMDPESRAMLGNIPQGLSHLALVDAAFALQGDDGGGLRAANPERGSAQ